MNLIDEIAETIESELKRLWPFQSQTETTLRSDLAKDAERAAALAGWTTLSEEDLGVALARCKDEAERVAYIGRRETARESRKVALSEAETFQRGQNEQRIVYQDVMERVSKAFSRLTPSTFPKDDDPKATAKHMVGFLQSFSKAYAKVGKQSSADRLVEYLRALDYDHVWWLWQQWIASCLALDLREDADALISAVTSGDTPAAHHFARQAGRYKAHLSIAKAMIALRFDGDLPKALEIATNMKESFGDLRDVNQCFKAVSFLDQEVKKGRLELEFTRGNGVVIRSLKGGSSENFDGYAPSTALLTGKWDEGAKK